MLQERATSLVYSSGRASPCPVGWLGRGERPPPWPSQGLGSPKAGMVPLGPGTSQVAELDTAPPHRDKAKLFLYIIISLKLAQPPPRAGFSSAKPTWKFNLSGLPRNPILLPFPAQLECSKSWAKQEMEQPASQPF